MQKSKIITILIIVLVLVVAVTLFYMGNKKTVLAPIENNPIFDTQKDTKTEILGNKADLISFSIEPGQKVSGPMTVFGIVKGGYFFEGEITIIILDANKNPTSFGPRYAIATTDWMTAGPVSFSFNIDFSNIPTGPAYIEVHNNNPGWPDEGLDKSILIPIIIQ